MRAITRVKYHQLTWYNTLSLWRWLLHSLSKRQSLPTTTVLFRTTFTRTIILSLLRKWLLGSNLSQQTFFIEQIKCTCLLHVTGENWEDLHWCCLIHRMFFFSVRCITKSEIPLQKWFNCPILNLVPRAFWLFGQRGDAKEDAGASNLDRRNKKKSIERFYMSSWWPYWCFKTMKRLPCWCSKPILWELNSFLMQTLSNVPINFHRCWTRE